MEQICPNTLGCELKKELGCYHSKAHSGTCMCLYDHCGKGSQCVNYGEFKAGFGKQMEDIK